jgi:hypothetical protein
MEDRNMSTIEEKIRKLIALAGNNPSVHEAAAAFARAQELAAKHAIDLDALACDRAEADDAPRVESIQTRTIDTLGKIPAWRYQLLTEIAKVNRCKTFSWYENDGTGPRRTLHAYGQPSDLDTVAYMYAAISREIERLALAAARGKGRSWGRNFRLGAVHEIGQRLREAQRSAVQSAREQAFADGGETALVRIDRALVHAGEIAETVDRYGRERLKLRSGGGFQGAGSYGYGEGRAAGRGVSIGGGRAVGTGPRALKS